MFSSDISIARRYCHSKENITYSMQHTFSAENNLKTAIRLQKSGKK